MILESIPMQLSLMTRVSPCQRQCVSDGSCEFGLLTDQGEPGAEQTESLLVAISAIIRTLRSWSAQS